MKTNWRTAMMVWALAAGLFSASTGIAQERIFEQSWQEFRQSRQARQTIDPQKVDYDLMAAAVLHETNRRRAEHELDPLGHHQQVRQAAEIHARAMAEHEMVSHVNPHDPEIKTLQDRLDKVGLRPGFAAENVAFTFAIQYESGTPVYPREENGEPVFSYKPGGPPIPRHTYLSFAEDLLEQWMNSPGHRKNILHEEPRFLGAGHQYGGTRNGMDIFYAAQVFFTPLK